LHRDLR